MGRMVMVYNALIDTGAAIFLSWYLPLSQIAQAVVLEINDVPALQNLQTAIPIFSAYRPSGQLRHSVLAILLKVPTKHDIHSCFNRSNESLLSFLSDVFLNG